MKRLAKNNMKNIAKYSSFNMKDILSICLFGKQQVGVAYAVLVGKSCASAVLDLIIWLGANFLVDLFITTLDRR